MAHFHSHNASKLKIPAEPPSAPTQPSLLSPLQTQPTASEIWVRRDADPPIKTPRGSAPRPPACPIFQPRSGVVSIPISPTVNSRQLPQTKLPSRTPPIATRTNRSVGCPTAAVMRRTCLFRPSRRRNSIQKSCTFFRKRTGGSRGGNSGWGSKNPAPAGSVGFPSSTTPSRSCRRADSSGKRSTRTW